MNDEVIELDPVQATTLQPDGTRKPSTCVYWYGTQCGQPATHGARWQGCWHTLCATHASKVRDHMACIAALES